MGAVVAGTAEIFVCELEATGVPRGLLAAHVHVWRSNGRAVGGRARFTR
jgi:hypothetical protein